MFVFDKKSNLCYFYFYEYVPIGQVYLFNIFIVISIRACDFSFILFINKFF